MKKKFIRVKPHFGNFIQGGWTQGEGTLPLAMYSDGELFIEQLYDYPYGFGISTFVDYLRITNQ